MKINFRRILLFGSFSVMTLTAMTAICAQPVELPMQKSVNRLVDRSRIKKSHLGLVIADAGGKILAKLNADRRMTPASLTKIVTAATILEKMPIGHQFVTQLMGAEPNSKGVIEGPIYLRGGGDPGFVSESMWCLVDEFLRTGVKTVHGDIVVDDSYFDHVRLDPSRDQKEVDRAYDSPIGAMTFNWSTVNVFVRPGLKAGDKARVFIDPANDYINVVNNAETVAAGEKTQIEVSNTTIENGGKTPGHNTILVNGRIAVGADEFVAYKAITEPDIWAGSQLKAFLHRRGIEVTGKIRNGVTPSTAKVLATNKSKIIPELVAEMMKYSNNYIAEILTKDLGAQIKGPPGTMSKGLSVIHEFLKEMNFQDGDDTIVSPSGLSKLNAVRPIDLLHVLEHVRRRFQIYPEYAVSLPIGGVDGTLKHWLKGSDLEGVVRAKTGHLTGVVGLGGFAGARDGRLYEFIFILNGTNSEASRAATLFNSLVSELLKPQ